MRKTMIILTVAIVLNVASACFLFNAYADYCEKSEWLDTVIGDWEDLKGDYWQDIADIDQIRDDLKFERDVSSKLKELAMRFQKEGEESRKLCREMIDIHERSLAEPIIITTTASDDTKFLLPRR